MMNQAEKAELLEQLEQWNKKDEYSRCIRAIEAIPEQERGYLLSYGQRNHQREISRPHWPGTGGHMPPLWRTHGGHAGAGWPG